MKYITFLLVLSIFSAGCKSPAQSEPQTKKNDVPAASQKQDKKNPATPKAAKKEDNKVYGSAEFGMSFQQVADLPEFKGWIQDTYTPYICKFDEQIGSEKYRVTFYFHQDKLYRADFSTAHDLYRPAESLETDIRNEVVNFRDFISQTYGVPTTDNGIPRRPSSMAPGYIVFAYKWQIGDKRITIGISESRAGKEYKMVAEIYDEPTYQATRADSTR